ncbi:hypothetical protein ABIC32_000789 [Brevundimonas sp. 1080]
MSTERQDSSILQQKTAIATYAVLQRVRDRSHLR